MLIYIISVGYWFCIAVEMAVGAYVFMSWLPFTAKFVPVMTDIMNPLLNPIRKLLNRSVFQMRGVDISPIILYLLAAYGAQICVALR